MLKTHKKKSRLAGFFLGRKSGLESENESNDIKSNDNN